MRPSALVGGLLAAAAAMMICAGCSTSSASSPAVTSGTSGSAAGPGFHLRPVLCQIPNFFAAQTTSVATGMAVPLNSPMSLTEAQADCAAYNAAQLPTTPLAGNTADAYVILPYYDRSIRYVLGPADMTGNAVADASVELSQASQYSVNLTFTNSGSATFDKIAAVRYPCYQRDSTNPPYCSLEAFELDGVVESAPTIEAASFNGTAVISGSTAAPFTSSQASDLVLAIRAARVLPSR